MSDVRLSFNAREVPVHHSLGFKYLLEYAPLALAVLFLAVTGTEIPLAVR